MTELLAIVGASGHGKVVADIAEQLGYAVHFYDDAFPNKMQIEHWPILGATADLIELGNSMKVVVAIGNNEVRAKKTNVLKNLGFKLTSLVHPTAVVSQYASIGDGSVIFANSVINAFTIIGSGCIINSAAIVEHDCNIGDFVHICPNSALAGAVSVGHESWIGIGASIRQLISIGESTIIGAGSTVLKNIPDNVTAFGSPCVVRNINGKVI